MSISNMIHTLENETKRGIDHLHRLLMDLDIDDAWIARHMPVVVPPRSYHRNLLHHGSDYELVLATWPAGGRTLIHDHGNRNSYGMVRVLTGQIFNHIYKRDGRTDVAEDRQLVHRSGEYIQVPVGLIHAMGNHGPEVAMSLHLYSPMIVNVSYWDPATLEPYQQSA
ncbi:MAG: cysteine dioxygenase family protein [Acidobacteriota bacterium]|nr:cysteine dioxygenase family protein [Acidobacteriota bacterium]